MVKRQVMSINHNNQQNQLNYHKIKKKFECEFDLHLNDDS